MSATHSYEYLEHMMKMLEPHGVDIQDLLNGFPAPLLLLDENSMILAVNETAAEMIGRQASELVGVTLGIVLSLEGVNSYEFHRPDDVLVNVELDVKESVYQGQLVYIAFLRDVSGCERVKAWEEDYAQLAVHVAESTFEMGLLQAELTRASMARDSFLASMSHELRTPLNSVLGYAEILLGQNRGPLNEYQVKAVSAIEDSGRQLLSLVNNVLELHRIETGKLKLQIEPTLLDVICQSSLQSIKSAAKKKNITVDFSLDDSVSIIHSDQPQLKRMLSNMLENAVKFTSEGGKIGLDVRYDLEMEAIRFVVWDTGIGIASEHYPRLFKPFMQLDSSVSRYYEGTGLGLALTARLAALHGGSIYVESDLGNGSRFVVSLPHSRFLDEVAKSAKGDEAPVEVKPVSKKKVLIADEILANAQQIAARLAECGYCPLIVGDGNEVIYRASDEVPDLLLCSAQIAVLDGLEVTRLVRGDSVLKDMVILMISTIDFPGNRERFELAGVDEYVVRPISVDKLVRKIEVYLNKDSDSK